MAAIGTAEGWARDLEGLAPRFSRAEPRRRAMAHLRGLLSPLDRKNGWRLAETAGDATPDGVQDFLSRMRWNADAVRDAPRAAASYQAHREKAAAMMVALIEQFGLTRL